MNVYIYKAALYCEDCGYKIKKKLLQDGDTPSNIFDESSFDSDDYPKGPYSNGGGVSDTPQHCDDCGEFLENTLTDDGFQYVIESIVDRIRNGSGSLETVESWATFYSISLHDIFEHLYELRPKMEPK